ncbi:NAD(P)/FAD-dependent oxidoreductase [Vineibacter terrae]|uniref:NAD(P)/FAD-dependent oxidoreductase n=1 Tax=Vineibacter terrae TaxID=2586908 RepID=UPI002E3355DF|nr:FAD-dependent oxidoreductase [Vineibacter terrae]HEX2885389.1 FAD-dependent oxidoreductase [Vineibacter terrae]
MTRVLIIGSGFAGMWAALGAARARRDLGAAASSIDIDVVAPSSMLCLKPRLYQRHEPVFEVDIAPLLSAVGVSFSAGTVASLDVAAHAARLIGDPAGLSYDALVVAAGSHTTPPPRPWRPYVHVLDSATEAFTLRRHVAGLPQRPPSPGRFTAVVVGAGFTGLEIATELGGWLRDLAAGSGEAARVLMLDRADTPGASLGAGPRATILEALAKTGVTFRPLTSVSNITATDSDNVLTLADGSRIEAATVVWAAGLRANPLAGLAGPAADDGRLTVDSMLRVAGQDRIFAAGDSARASAAPGHDTLMSCQHAMPTGRVAGHNAVRSLAGAPLIPYTQPGYQTCLDLGEAGGMLSHGWERAVVWNGAKAKAVKRFINGPVIAPPAADRALELAHATPMPVATAEELAVRWQALLGDQAA